MFKCLFGSSVTCFVIYLNPNISSMFNFFILFTFPCHSLLAPSVLGLQFENPTSKKTIWIHHVVGLLFRCQLWTLWVLLWEPKGSGQSRASTSPAVWRDGVVCQWFAYRDAERLDPQPATEGSRDAAELRARSPLHPKEGTTSNATLWMHGSH